MCRGLFKFFSREVKSIEIYEHFCYSMKYR